MHDVLTKKNKKEKKKNKNRKEKRIINITRKID